MTASMQAVCQFGFSGGFLNQIGMKPMNSKRLQLLIKECFAALRSAVVHRAGAVP
ncbi:MAG: hypothetical protein ACWA6Y_05750 [Polaromonas sp.]